MNFSRALELDPKGLNNHIKEAIENCKPANLSRSSMSSMLMSDTADLTNSVNVEDITSVLRNDHVLTQREGFDDDVEEFVISEDEDDDL